MAIVTHGTVKKHSPFNPEEDAKILRKAMKGLGMYFVSTFKYKLNMRLSGILGSQTVQISRRLCVETSITSPTTLLHHEFV